MRQILSKHRKELIQTLALLLVFLFCAVTILRQPEYVPGNVLQDRYELLPEEMTVSTGIDDVSEGEIYDDLPEEPEPEPPEEIPPEEVPPEEEKEEQPEEEKPQEQPEEEKPEEEKPEEQPEEKPEEQPEEEKPKEQKPEEKPQDDQKPADEEPEKDPEEKEEDPQDPGQGEQPGDNEDQDDPDRKPGSDPDKPVEDEDADGGNKTGPADDDKPTGDEGDGKTGQEDPLPQRDPDEAIIVTDLNGYDNPRIITYSELPDALLSFRAYIENAEEDMDLRVRLSNDETGSNGTYLTADGDRYQAALANGRNRITLYLRKNGVTDYSITYTIRYVPDKASEENPSVGANPPVITAFGSSGTDDFTEPIRNPNYSFRVQAVDYQGRYLPYDNIQIVFTPEVGESRVLNVPTGSGIYEYDLFFEPPVSGESYQAKVTVTAWDNDGNSTFRSYTLTYVDVSEGTVIGRVGVYIDLTTIGFGIEYGGYEYEVKKGDKASDAVLAALDYYGITPIYSGTAHDNFYLRGISTGFLCYGAEIPSMLEDLLVLDGLPPTQGYSNDSLSEFDFTAGSGWMYTIDGVSYPGRGMSRFELTGSETITLRFTLAMGKDLGLTSYDKGLLSHYCGSWFNGAYHPHHVYEDGGGAVEPGGTCEEEGKIMTWHCLICQHYFMSADHESEPAGYESEIVDEPYITTPAGTHQWEETSKVEPTATEDGYIEYTCKVCHETKRDVLPKTGEEHTEHEWEETSRVEPTATEDGYVEYTCKVCHETKRDVLPKTGEEHTEHEWEETSRVEPTATEDGYVEYTCKVCHETKRDVLPKTGEEHTEHSWEEVSRTEATESAPGEVIYRCSVCGEERTEVLPQLEHTEHSWEEISRTEATESAPGEVVYRCSVCGEERTEVLPQLEHTEHSWEEVSRTEPTATEDGAVTYRCSVCGEERTDVLPKTGEEGGGESGEGGEDGESGEGGGA
ncbi:MAG: hypothetical protein IIY82_02000 [Firmicutes bacterium]|nr:hypothetical protein [Bacillota bacterium]